MAIRLVKLPCLILTWAFILMAARCSFEAKSAEEQAFKEILQTQDVNESLSLSLLGEGDEFNRRDSIDFVVENTSNEAIVLPHDFGARGFFYDRSEGKWYEVNNLITYYPERDRILGPEGGELTSHDIVGFIPDDNGLELPIKLRVVVYGRFFRDNEITDEMVAAYAETRITE